MTGRQEGDNFKYNMQSLTAVGREHVIKHKGTVSSWKWSILQTLTAVSTVCDSEWTFSRTFISTW